LEEPTDGVACVYIFTPTWIDDDQLHEDQIPLCEKGEPGQRLGDGWLLPHPLRRIVEVAPGLAKVEVCTVPN
jgi:hypothetical protein